MYIIQIEVYRAHTPHVLLHLRYIYGSSLHGDDLKCSMYIHLMIPTRQVVHMSRKQVACSAVSWSMGMATMANKKKNKKKTPFVMVVGRAK